MPDTAEEKKIKKTKQILAKNFKLIGLASTPYTRKMKIGKINKYRRRIIDASMLTTPDNAAKEYLEKMEQRSEKIKELEKQQQSAILEGSSKMIPKIVESFMSSLVAIFRGQRLGHHVLKIAIALILLIAVILAIIYLPVFSVPFLEFTTTLLGKTATLTAAVIGFGVAFKVAEFILDKTQPVSDSVLRIWKNQTNIDENVVNIMQQYLINAEKVSQTPSIKKLLRAIRKQEMTNPCPQSLQKLVMFFSKQLLKLRKEKDKLEALPKSSDQQKKLDQVNLDIMAVSFILNELFSLPWVPSEAHIYIEERTQHLPAHEKRKMHRRAALAAAEEEAEAPILPSPGVSFSKSPSSTPGASKGGKADKPKKPKAP